MYRKIVLLLCVISFISILNAESNVNESNRKYISVTDFGAVPDDGLDGTKALRRAAEYCRMHPGTILKIPSGIYRLCDTKAEKLEKEVLSGKLGGNPEKAIFTPYFPYVRGLDFEGSSDVTIEAYGATIMCEGWNLCLLLIAGILQCVD